MDITPANLTNLFTGYSTAFQEGFGAAPSHYASVAMTVPSTGRSETYGFLSRLPVIRQWIGDRLLQRLGGAKFELENLDFESTVTVPRNDILDDRFGVFAPMVREMGQTSREHPDQLVFALAKEGFTRRCFDGQYFFDADHPVGDGTLVGVTSQSNVQPGDGPAWFLIDGSRAIRPFVWQERQPYNFTALTDDGDHHVFMRNEYVYGVHARVNAGFGMWQLAFGSKAPLTPANYAAARAAMQNFRKANGDVIGVQPTHLIVPPALEEKARTILFADETNGNSNVWRGSAEMILTPFVA